MYNKRIKGKLKKIPDFVSLNPMKSMTWKMGDFFIIHIFTEGKCTC